MPNNFYELLWIFLIYAFLGWCMEVAYAAVNTGKFQDSHEEIKTDGKINQSWRKKDCRQNIKKI